VDIEIMDNIIEQMGTGIMRMKNAAKEAKVSAPEFELSGFFKVTFKRNIASISNIAQLSATSDKQAIGKRLISDCQAIETSDRKSEILAYIEEHKRATASEASGLLGLSKARVRAILREMVSDGTIEKVGDNRYAYYVRR
jgi:predicted HTH transcriptional regulator